MLFLTLVVFGWKSYQQLPINLMPDISYPTLTVRTEYEGAAPEDIEKLITRPLEETLSIVSGMVEISSVSSPSVSEIVLEFTWDTDMKTAQQDVRDRLDLFQAPIEITEKPVILRYDPTLDPVLRVAITPPADTSGGDPASVAARQSAILTSIREAAERHVKSDLEAEEGIAQVGVKGGQEQEIQVLVDSERLKNLGLSILDVATSLAQQNINLSGGRLKEGKTEYLVRTLNEFRDVREIGKTFVANAGGMQVRLEDVADVAMGVKERDTVVRINGQEAVELEVYKEGDANTVQVCNRLKDLLGFERRLSLSERLSVLVARMSNPEAADIDAVKSAQLSRTIHSHLPRGCRLTLISDQSRFIEGSIDDVKQSAILGGALALVILYFFLREMRSTVAIGIAIPISVITVFIPMYLRDISLNIMSLGGLALGAGMLVDNSIVVLESIYRCREEGDGIVEGANRGTREVAGAVVASTLTTVAVFFPIAFVEGMAGQIFRDQALAVTFSLLASLLVALFLNPMLASREMISLEAAGNVVWPIRAYHEARGARGYGVMRALGAIAPIGAEYGKRWLSETFRDCFGLGSPNGSNKTVRYSAIRRMVYFAFLPVFGAIFVFRLLLGVAYMAILLVLFALSILVVGIYLIANRVLRVLFWVPLRAFEWSFLAVRHAYETSLHHALRFSPLVLAAVALLALHAFTVSRNLGQELIPQLKQGEFGLRLDAPPGTRLEETERRAAAIERLALAIPEVETVAVQVGTERDKTSGNQGENVAQFTIQLANPKENVHQQDAIVSRLREQVAAVTPDDVMFTLPSLFSFKTAIELQIRGDDFGELRRVGQRVLEVAETVEGLKDPELSIRQGHPEVIIQLDRDLLAAKGVSPEQVAQRLRTEVQGDVATRFDQEGDKIDIRVRTDRQRLTSVAQLRSLSIVDGTPPIPLSAVARIEIVEGPSEIRRVDQRQVAIISGNVQGRDLGAVSRDLMARIRDIEKPSEFYFVLGGQNRELEESYRSLIFALALATFLVYVVMASQFESIGHPALIMFSVPLAFVGVVYALYLTGTDLSIVVFIGGIILAGIVVNNAIVLVDYVNRLRARGMPKRQALVEAGKVRLRPILMTTLTTVLGLVPMALWAGEGAEMRRPLAITVMAGLSSSTLLTLYIIPMLYYLFGGRDKTTPLDARPHGGNEGAIHGEVEA